MGKSISFFVEAILQQPLVARSKLPNAKTAPASCYGNRGGLLYFYLCSLFTFFKLSRNYLRGFLIAGWAGAKIIEYSETSMDVYGLSGSQMPCPFPAGRAADKPLCRTWQYIFRKLNAKLLDDILPTHLHPLPLSPGTAGRSAPSESHRPAPRCFSAQLPP